ncbi:hypothetical protein [Aromatoleum diolicum]|uniref:Uncharacterized protein n=1 Tax=Aromatoleum diolicum TaxID=75796 RepID=A0ABX1QC84_9RHOO|nr:hypothetical protein [Aromatoleum diolicum]NMG75645.1 hypothetical protein [Aromatoleum diolicum]
MHPLSHKLAAIALSSFALALPGTASAWDMTGTRTVALHTRDGQAIPIGTVTFQPQGDRTGFTLHLDEKPFKDFFLSMKEFKCLEGSEEILCHVPYPYANPATVTQNDLSWLEHALLFLYKTPAEFGARLWNGLYYRMRITDEGIVGTAESVDLNLIAAPPAEASVAPFVPAERTEIAPDSRWIGRLTIR